MNKKTTIVVIILSVLLVSLCTIAATYAVIIEVTENNGITEMVNEITVKDILTSKDGKYNNLYYDMKNELKVTDKEANTLIESTPINEALQDVLETVIDYKVNNNFEARLSETEIYNLISKAILETKNISDDVKSRIINKASLYRNDISDYIYNMEISMIGDNIWINT